MLALRIALDRVTLRDLAWEHAVGQYLVPRVPQVGEGCLCRPSRPEGDVVDRSGTLGGRGRSADVNGRRVPRGPAAVGARSPRWLGHRPPPPMSAASC